MPDFSFGSPLTGDAITREIFDEYKREHEVLRALLAKAREILAVLDAKDARAARPLIEQYRKIDPWR